MRPREAFGYHDSNPAVELACVPMPLLQDLLMERGEAKAVLVAILIDVGTQVNDMGPGRSLTKHATRDTDPIDEHPDLEE